MPSLSALRRAPSPPFPFRVDAVDRTWRLHSCLCLLLLALSCAPHSASASVSACLNGGTLLSTGVCSCPAGALGADCSIVSTAASPIYRGAFTSTLGMGIAQEWRIESAAGGATQLRMRWAAQTQSWFGAILDVGVSPTHNALQLARRNSTHAIPSLPLGASLC